MGVLEITTELLSDMFKLPMRDYRFSSRTRFHHLSISLSLLVFQNNSPIEKRKASTHICFLKPKNTTLKDNYTYLFHTWVTFLSSCVGCCHNISCSLYCTCAFLLIFGYTWFFRFCQMFSMYI